MVILYRELITREKWNKNDFIFILLTKHKHGFSVNSISPVRLLLVYLKAPIRLFRYHFVLVRIQNFHQNVFRCFKSHFQNSIYFCLLSSFYFFDLFRKICYYIPSHHFLYSIDVYYNYKYFHWWLTLTELDI